MEQDSCVDFSKIIKKVITLPNQEYYNSLKHRILTPNIIPSDFIIMSGNGASLNTNKGLVIDLCSMTVNCILGQNDPWVKAKLISYLLSDAPSFHSSRFGSEIFYSLPERLSKLHIAGIKNPVFNHRQCNGSDVTELAVKLASNERKGREKLVSLEGSYHGQNMTGYFVSEIQTKHQFLSVSDNVIFLPTPTYSQFGSDEISASDSGSLEILRSKASDVFAIIIEPIQMNNGINVLSKGFIAGLRKIADEYGICLIYDEIQTGMGWLGALSAAEILEVSPDIFCTSKALTSGFGALSMTVSTDKYKNLAYGVGEKTAGSDIRAMIAANAVLDRLLGIDNELIPDYVSDSFRKELSDGLFKSFPNKAAWLYQKLTELKDLFPNIIKSIKGAGFILGLEIVNLNGEADNDLADKIVKKALEYGVFVKCTNNTIIIKPPLVIKESELDMALSRLANVFSEL